MLLENPNNTSAAEHATEHAALLTRNTTNVAKTSIKSTINIAKTFTKIFFNMARKLLGIMVAEL